MTKADLLHALRRVALNDEIVAATRVDGTLHEIELLYSFVTTGPKGPVLVLAETCQVAGHYSDAETA